MSADVWAKVKAEYIAEGTSYRNLCEKYGVNLRTLARRAKKEEWQQRREERVNIVHKKCQQRAEEKAALNSAKNVDRMFAATEKLLRKTEQLLEIEDALAPRDLRSLASTLLDAQALMGIRDPKDREEQQARIEKMRAEIAAMNEEQTHQNRVEVVWVSNPWDTEDDDAAGAE